MTAGSSIEPVFELRDITKTYGAVRALRSVSLKLLPGEVVGLVGDNGAGKSTLSKVISGTIKPDAGEIRVDGRATVFETAVDARMAGIETVFQTLAVVPTLDIPANMYLGREEIRKGFLGKLFRLMDRGKMQRDAEEGFRKLGLKLPDLRTKVGALSGGQRQAVAIARAVLWGSKIVVLDEPTAALGVHQTEMVLSFIERLREHGVTVVFISHNMQNVLRVADRVVVMRLGQKVFEGEGASLDGARLVSLITGASEVQAAP
ncbi:ATP-binding cassette domain-containing protein [Corticibacterium sp. UT-5YL-CI-8]|nr:ATP-binding cassette domain-containing protein [Tianweitania sp. UT-5YL-CI-8]